MGWILKIRRDALAVSSVLRSHAEVVLAFLLIVLALVLPVKTLILGPGGGPGSGGAISGAPGKRELVL